MSIYLGDVGTEIIIDCGAPISAATKCEIKFSRPSGTTGTWIATLKTTTSISYVTQADDIDELGLWWVQAYIETPAWKLYGKATTIEVLSPLQGR